MTLGARPDQIRSQFIALALLLLVCGRRAEVDGFLAGQPRQTDSAFSGTAAAHPFIPAALVICSTMRTYCAWLRLMAVTSARADSCSAWLKA